MITCRLSSFHRRASGRPILIALGLAVLPLGHAEAKVFSRLEPTDFAPGVDLNASTVFGGLAIADLNNDGLLDIVILNGTDSGDPPRLLRNKGGNRFEEAMGALDSSEGNYPSGVLSVGDYDNDGDVDLFATDNQVEVGLWIWENNLIDNGYHTPVEAETPFSFTLRSSEALGSAAPSYAVGLALGDFDADGDIDLAYDNPLGRQVLLLNKLIHAANPALEGLYFEAKTDAFPSSSTDADGGMDLSAVDVDLDGDLDLLTRSNYESANTDLLYFNDGTGKFKDAVATNGASFSSEAATYSSATVGVSTAWADYDNDAEWDALVQNPNMTTSPTYATRFYVVDWASSSDKFSLTNRNVSSDIGVVLTSYNSGTGDSGGGIAFGDFNNDGYVDLYVGSPSSSSSLPDKLYLNAGPPSSGTYWRFSEQTSTQEPDIFGNTIGDSEAVGQADLDHDGDLDLYLHNASRDDRLFVNGTQATSNARRYLRVRATCGDGLRDCIGAVVQVFKAGDQDGNQIPDAYRPGFPGYPGYPGDTIDYSVLSNSIVPNTLLGMQQVEGGMGLGAQRSFVLHFGLPFNDLDGDGDSDAHEAYYTVRVLFPGGKVILRDVQPSASSASFNGLTLSQFVSIDQDDASEDGDGLPAAIETAMGTFADDLDSDDDGLMDTYEAWTLGTDPAAPDSDGDGVWDGTELGVTSGVKDMDGSTGPLEATDPAVFKPDTGTGTTDPLDSDTDGDGLLDGAEDKDVDGALDAGIETSPLDVDTDDDGLTDGAEVQGYTWTNGSSSKTYTSDPLRRDTDADGLYDGREVGLLEPMIDPADLPNGISGTDRDAGNFQADTEDGGAKSTDPRLKDTDIDGLEDGYEDTDRDGAWDSSSETDPTVADTNAVTELPVTLVKSELSSISRV